MTTTRTKEMGSLGEEDSTPHSGTQAVFKGRVNKQRLWKAGFAATREWVAPSFHQRMGLV